MLAFQQKRAGGTLRAVFAVLFLGAVVTLSQTKPVQAQAAPKFGSVDLVQVLSESKAQQKDAQELKSTLTSLQQVLLRLQETGARFLSEVEIKELAGLYEKKTPSDAEKKRIGALEDAASLKIATKTRLENTAMPNDDQRKQYTDITAAERGGQQTLTTLQNDYRQRMDTRQSDAQTKTLTAIRAAVAKVAKDQGLAVVFDSQAAVYTANDITADVIKEINK